jgi:exodeoxyribonuclease V alpha subunit
VSAACFQVLADIIGSGRLPIARLTEVFRQAAESRIVVNAHRINHGQMPEPTVKGDESDFYFVEIGEPEEGVAKLIEMVRNRIPKRFGLDPLKDIQVLCPMNRGLLGARNLNHELQRVLNPNPPASIERFGWKFSPGDRVMETQNDYDREVFNGDLGTVDRIDEDEGALVVNFEGREVIYPFGELDTLVPAFATTIHKSQGSEYPAVVIPVTTQHYTMLARNLVYTGVTRGKRLVVLIGQRKALGIAVRGGVMKPRWTKLRVAFVTPVWLGWSAHRSLRHLYASFPLAAVAHTTTSTRYRYEGSGVRTLRTGRVQRGTRLLPPINSHQIPVGVRYEKAK